MQAIEYNRPGKLLLKNLPVPEPEADEVCIKVAYSGICGTDLHIMREESPSADRVVLGHEFSGIISSTGSAVQSVSAGDPVAVDPNNYCGHCDYCKNGQIHFCRNIKPIGVYRGGAWAEYCLVPEAQVYRLDSHSDLEWGALAEPLSCILHGWDRLQPLNANHSICIMGAGLIGLLWSLLLRDSGFNNLQITEVSEERIQRAKNMGYTTYRPEDIFDSSNGKNTFDVIIDCSGNPKALEQSINWLKPMGKFLFFGICPEDTMIRINPFKIFQKELSLLGSVINPFTFSRALGLIIKFRQPLEDLGVVFYPLERFKEAIEAVGNGNVTKVIFKL